MDWTQINLTEVFNGAMIAGALFLAWLSRRLGIRSAAHRMEPMQLAGAVIDKVQAKTIVAAVTANTAAIEEQTRATRQTTRDTVHALEQLEGEVQNLTLETIRAGRGGSGRL